MTLRTLFLYGLYLSGGVALVPVLLGLGWPALVAGGLWSLAALHELRGGTPPLQGRRGTAVSYTVALLILLVGWGNLFDRIYEFLLWLLTVRYLSPKDVRESFQILLLAVATLAAGGILYPGPAFAVVFLVFLFLSILTGAVVYAYAEGGDRPLTREARRDLIRLIAPYETGTLLLALMFFVLLPRSTMPLFAPVVRQEALLPGIADTLDLGNFASLLQDGRIALRLQILNGEGQPPFYLRLREYQRFDGRRWYPRTAPPGIPRLRVRRIQTYELLVEPSDLTSLPALEYTYRLDQGPVGAQILRNGEIRVPPRYAGQRHRILARAADAAWLEPPRPMDVQLPDHLTPLLAESLNVWADTSLDGPHLAARLVRKFLTFRYSLEVPRLRQDPLESFLVSRTGYCEYFATALTLMLRMRGISARMVGGYAGGRWNPQGAYYTFAQQNAHTWVEAWFPGEGWVRLDPTPARAQQTEPMPLASGWLDYVRLLWFRRVVQYSAEDQQAMARGVGRWWKRYRPWLQKGLLAGLGLGLLFLLGWPWIHRWRPFRKKEDPVRAALLAWLSEMEAQLPRAPGEGLGRYARRAARVLHRPEVPHIMALYMAYRYGQDRKAGQRFLHRIRRISSRAPR